MKKVYNPYLAILFVCIGIGVIFIHAGWLKLTDIQMVVDSFTAAGIPAALAYFVS